MAIDKQPPSDELVQLQRQIIELNAELMAVREGLIRALSLLGQGSPGDVLNQIDARKRYFHDRFLKGIEDMRPDFAAQLDDRNENDAHR